MTESPSVRVSDQTERTVRDFVRAAVSRLSAMPSKPPEWVVGSRWELGADGLFRESEKRMPPMLY